MRIVRGARCIESVEPRQSRFDVRKRNALCFWRPCDHNNRDLQRPRRRDLAVGLVAAGVLGDDDVDPLAYEEGFLGLRIEWRAGLDEAHLWRQRDVAGGVDRARDVGVLWRGRERSKLKSPDREEDAAWRFAEGLGRFKRARDHAPGIAVACLPWRADERSDGDARRVGRNYSVGGDPHREGMGCIDDGANTLVDKIAVEALRAAEAADPCWQRQGARSGRAAGERYDRVETVISAKMLCEPARFARAA